MENIDLQTIKKIIILSLQELILNDLDIFTQETKIIEFNNIQDGSKGNRLVHETGINHRFAYYLENNLKRYTCSCDYFQVDIEYNRYFGQIKENNGDNIRPDILIHKRQGNTTKKDNLLVIEAKKIVISNEDNERVKQLMNDKEKKYLYQYGLTVVYCNNNDSEILCNLYFKNEKEEISCDTFKINKTSP